MSSRIITDPTHPVLTSHAVDVASFDSRRAQPVGGLIDRLTRAVNSYGGGAAGAAAPQIGVALSVFVGRTTVGSSKLVPFVNPLIVDTDGEQTTVEGCLSLPGQKIEVVRWKSIGVRAFDARGNEHEYELDGFPAVIFQHELDHLYGILMTDSAAGLRRTTRTPGSEQP